MRRSARLVPELLRVGVGDHEIDALQIERDHIIHRIAAAAAHPDHGIRGMKSMDVSCEIVAFRVTA